MNALPKDFRRRMWTLVVAYCAIVLVTTSGYAAFHVWRQRRVPVVAFPTKISLGRVPQGNVIHKTVRLQNSGTQEIRVSKVLTSCGCTAAKVNGRSIAPGQYLALNVTFNSAGKREETSGIVQVYFHGENRPPLIVPISAYVDRVFDVFPSRIEMGTVRTDNAPDVRIRIRNLNESPFEISRVEAPEFMRLKANRINAYSFEISGGISTNVRPGRYSGSVVVRTDHETMPAIIIPVSLTVSGVYKVVPEICNYGIVETNASIANILTISGAPVGDIAVDHTPPGTSVCIMNKSPMECSALITLRPKGGASGKILSEKVTLRTGIREQPVISIPIYAAIR